MRSCREPSGADLNHSIISSLGLSALGSLHTAKRFIGLAIGVRTRSRDLHLLASRSYENDCGFSICLFPFPEIGSGAYPMAPAGGRMAVGVYVFLQYGNRIPRLGPSLSDALS